MKSKLFVEIRTKIRSIFANARSAKGQSLIELILAIGLSAIILPAVFLGFISSREGKPQLKQRFEAVTLLKQAQEAARTARENGWSNVSNNGTYHPVAAGNTWTLASGSETINGFVRSITISDVLRDSNGAIAASGTLDPSTKKIVVTVSWQTPYSSNISSTSYLTRFTNSSYTQTTLADFQTGTTSGTVLTNTAGGEVTLGAGGGGGDWCNPTLSVTTVDLSRQGVPTAISAISGNVVTGTGGNASGPTFVDVRLTGNNPPQSAITGQFNNSKANGVFTESNYGYIATTSNSEEIQILDLNAYSNPPTNTLFSKIGTFNAPGNGQGDSVFIKGTVGYMTDNDKFYTFDMTSHTGVRAQINTTTAWSLAGKGNKVVVVGNYAYVAVNSTTTQLQVIDVSDPAHPSIVASAALGNSQPGIDVAVNSSGTRAYMVTSYAGVSSPDFFIINTSTKSGSLPKIGTGFNTNGMDPKGIAIATGNRAILVGTGGVKQYQVLNIVNESTPTSCATLAITNGAYAVSSILQNDGYAYSYIVTGDTNAELKIILGGAGGQYTNSGTYTSSIFDPGFNVSFNRLYITTSVPSQTSFGLQVAIADAVANSCTNANYSYVGPDGTSNTFFTQNLAIPNDDDGVGFENPGRCLKYKVFLSTNDYTQSPILDDVSVNYSY